MSQLSFFDVDLSQSPEEHPLISATQDRQSQCQPKKHSKGQRLASVNASSNRDFHKAFTQLFHQTARYHSRSEVFRDFIHIATISLENSVKQCPELEQTYFKVIARYEKEDLNAFAKLLAICVNALDHQATDFLGELFMTLELGDGRWGQFFTPFQMSQLMAELILGDCRSHIEQKGYISVCEPTCGKRYIPSFNRTLYMFQW